MHEHEHSKRNLYTAQIERRVQGLSDAASKRVFRPWIGAGSAGIFDLISQYWGRQFTYETDTLDAFRGILSTYRASEGLIGQVQGLPLFYP